MSIIFTLLGLLVVLVALVIASVKIIRPMERGLVERFGKYNRFASPGLNFIIPFVERMVAVNITERMVNAEQQEIITKDKLNAFVDAQVYFKVKPDEEDVKASQYNVYDYKYQIVNLARTTLRNIIGTLTLNEANSERNRINEELMKTLTVETKNWGIEVVRTELKEIAPPKDVQETMNKVVKAENEKQAAIDFATATETKADGDRRAAIKLAEGQKQAEILKAEGAKQALILQAQGQAENIKLVNEAANKYFVGNAQRLKRLEVTQASLQGNSKIIVTKSGVDPVLVIGSGDENVIPIKSKKKSTDE